MLQESLNSIKKGTTGF